LMHRGRLEGNAVDIGGRFVEGVLANQDQFLKA
jgi:hypothetical protein